jgi:hypothetical protein
VDLAQQEARDSAKMILALVEIENVEEARQRAIRQIHVALRDLAVLFQSTSLEPAPTDAQKAVYAKYISVVERGGLPALEKPTLESILEELNALKRELRKARRPAKIKVVPQAEAGEEDQPTASQSQEENPSPNTEQNEWDQQGERSAESDKQDLAAEPESPTENSL